ncbi:MAG: MraY family glycosyltransferase [Bacteroidetes bacterium]|nr:MraY family glycosyltransferase [Bacteroidota bacterium]
MLSNAELILLSCLTAFLICFFSIPSIINIAKIKHLLDEPDERKSHTQRIPTLGGLAIFAGLIVSLCLFSNAVFPERRFITCAIVVVFFIGMKDDIIVIAPVKKMLGQIVAVTIVVVLGDVRLHGFYGFMGIEEINEYLSIALSIFTILVIMNGFNLIDGINTLAASVGILILAVFGCWFYLSGHEMDWSILAFTTMAALLAFLYYNISPAKIFMGDTGSLISGLVIGVLTIKFIDINAGLKGEFLTYQFNSVPIVAFGILIAPLFDTLRVFTLRLMDGKSPLHPDQNHIHHRLLDLGLTHVQSSITIVLGNIFIIALVITLQYFNVGGLWMLLIVIGICSFLAYTPSLILKKNKAAQSISDTV